MKKILCPHSFYRFCASIVLTILIVIFYLCQKNIPFFDIKVIRDVIMVVMVHILAIGLVDKLLSFPGKQSWLQVLFTVGVSYCCVFGILPVFFVNISKELVLINGIVTCLLYCFDFWWRDHHPILLAYVPFGDAATANELPKVRWLKLDQPVLPQESFQAVVVDLYSLDLNPEWQKFLAQITLSNIPVYHIRQVEEFLTGQVKIRRMYENNLGSLFPSRNYMAIKRIMDIVLIVASLPVSLPIMLLTALAVKIESPKDSIIFKQKRVGQYGKEFIIYKFRSMIVESEKNGAQFAQLNDKRITRVGFFLRKTRLDELPQFWNILKGEMSLIGPRPEQKVFVEKFEQIIPFYNYRCVVKPGLTGWAQVIQGYAASEKEIKLKLIYDFYYIKHISIFLDVAILLKTIRYFLDERK